MPEREGEYSARDRIKIVRSKPAQDGSTKVTAGGDVREIAEQLESIPLLPEEQEAPEATEPVTPAPEPAKPSEEPTSTPPALKVAPTEPPTEPEPEEVEPEPDDLPPEPEPEPTRQPDARGRKLRMPDGTTQWVTVDEAYAGYLRQSDYTRKRQADADKSRQLDALIAEHQQARDHYVSMLKELEETLETATPKEPDWAEERRVLPPEQYLEKRETWDAYKRNRDTLKTERAAVEERKRKDFEKTKQTTIEQETQKLLAVVPEWTNDEVYQREYAAMVRHAKAIGFSIDEVNGTVDHRLLVLLRQAALGSKAAAPAPTAAPGAAPVVRRKPGVIRTVTPGSALDNVARPGAQKTEKRRAFERQRKAGGSIESTQAVMEHLIDAGEIE